ncbi:His-Xaa-Ser system radical SAM maturase HxsB [Photobacterium sp. CCB-ST2H9]|uniref:His-Xaa-Ser system radical SAM maturase HxsB n=1 Tax=Photobacterium sp. CCB-ST2H9 TaxID=2912855 RepID=UPI0020043F88|nr:His-Xaa-Ser system radical SAM maturase HxsB [Photobacterium sp. CCB-ST2H9]UTM59573.1 His-Xaa-Ser system radical SAM maturase HxsB [Photobacterium sp. CCB-ST2H9]
MNILPFNFEFIDKDLAFLSNQSGFYEYLSREELENLICENSTGCRIKDDSLERKLFITDPEYNMVASSALASGISKRLMNALRFNPIFMIVPTLRCDHTCRYCQVSRASVNASNYDLDERLIPLIMKQIKSLSSPPYKLEIQGGEPLLRFDLVQRIYAEASDILGVNQFEFVIATSLSLLSDDVLIWGKDKSVHFSTSLDGSQFVHNANRLLKNGNSFELVKKGIEKIQRQLGNNRIATVTTVTNKLLSNPEDIVEAHISLGLSDMFIRPISPYGFAYPEIESNYKIQDYIAFYEKLLYVLYKKSRVGEKIIEHSALIHIKRVLSAGYNGYADLKSPSGLILNSILYNYDGRIYGSDEARMLQKSNPNMDFSLGTIETPKFTTNELYQRVLSQSFSSIHPGCSSCAYQPYCGSDPCQNISIFGEPIGDKSLSRFCQYHKAMFTLILRHLYKNDGIGLMMREWMYE